MVCGSEKRALGYCPETVSGMRTCVKSCDRSVDPLREVVARLEFRCDLLSVHGRVLREVLRIFPLEELDALLGHGYAPEMAVCGRLLVLGLPQGQRLGDGAWPAIKGDLDNIGDVFCSEGALLCAIGLHEERQWLRHADGVGQLHKRALAETALHN